LKSAIEILRRQDEELQLSLIPTMTIRSLPLITDLSKCSNSVHKIYTETDIGNWINSEAYEYIEIMIERLNAAVEGKTVEDPCVESAVRFQR
jgi:hypothetical protein